MNNTTNIINRINEFEANLLIDGEDVVLKVEPTTTPYIVLTGVIAGAFITYWRKDITDTIAKVVEGLRNIPTDAIDKFVKLMGNEENKNFMAAVSIIKTIREYIHHEFYFESQDTIDDFYNRAIDDVVSILRLNKN